MCAPYPYIVMKGSDMRRGARIMQLGLRRLQPFQRCDLSRTKITRAFNLTITVDCRQSLGKRTPFCIITSHGVLQV